MRVFWQTLFVLIGTLLVAIGFNGFFIPYHLASGGLAGIALVIGQIMGWPLGLQVVLYNIPILWFAWRSLGRKFLILSVVGIAGLTLFLSLVPIRALVTDDPMLNAIFGGIVVGLGVGITMRAGGSCGGFDVAAVAVNQRYSIPIGDVMLGLNALIVGMAGVLGDLKVVLYTIIAMFVTGKMIDLITAGTVKKTVLIVTSRAPMVTQRIRDELTRGVTVLSATGAYTGERRHLLLCVVTRAELAPVKELVSGTDPDAFLTVLDTDQVMGRFHGYNPFTRGSRTVA